MTHTSIQIFFSITFTVILTVLLTACLPHPGKLSKLPRDINVVESKDVVPLSAVTSRTMTIQYLGTGGLYLLHKGEGILIDPFFSNPKIGKLVTSVLRGKPKVKANQEMVTFGLSAIEEQSGKLAPQVKAIFVAHSHYDHLLDVPAVFKKLGKQPTVYLNQSGYNICYNAIDRQKMVVLENHMTTNETTRPPIELTMSNGKVNVYPILADHNPHIKHIKTFDGDITKPLANFESAYAKTCANTWLEGNTFSFVVDYLDQQNNIELRLFIQSSSCNPMYGIPPKTLPEHKVDIALLGVASYDASSLYPQVLLDSLKPKKVVWIHWEDFFRKYTKEPKTVRATDVPAFFQKDEVDAINGKAYLPWPRAVFEVRY